MFYLRSLFKASNDTKTTMNDINSTSLEKALDEQTAHGPSERKIISYNADKTEQGWTLTKSVAISSIQYGLTTESEVDCRSPVSTETLVHCTSFDALLEAYAAEMSIVKSQGYTPERQHQLDKVAVPARPLAPVKIETQVKASTQPEAKPAQPHFFAMCG